MSVLCFKKNQWKKKSENKAQVHLKGSGETWWPQWWRRPPCSHLCFWLMLTLPRVLLLSSPGGKYRPVFRGSCVPAPTPQGQGEGSPASLTQRWGLLNTSSSDWIAFWWERAWAPACELPIAPAKCKPLVGVSEQIETFPQVIWYFRCFQCLDFRG